MPFAINRSLSKSMQSPTHIECSSVFQETGTYTFFFFSEPCGVQIVFLFSFFFFNCSCQDRFFFGQSSKRLSAYILRCEHRRFSMVISVGLVLHILAVQGPCGELLEKQTSFLVQPYTLYARFALQNFTSLFSPATISLANLHETHDTRPFSNGTPSSQLRTN